MIGILIFQYFNCSLINRFSRLAEVKNLWKMRDCRNCVRIELAWEQFGHLYILTEFCGNGR